MIQTNRRSSEIQPTKSICAASETPRAGRVHMNPIIVSNKPRSGCSLLGNSAASSDFSNLKPTHSNCSLDKRQITMAISSKENLVM